MNQSVAIFKQRSSLIAYLLLCLVFFLSFSARWFGIDPIQMQLALILLTPFIVFFASSTTTFAVLKNYNVLIFLSFFLIFGALLSIIENRIHPIVYFVYFLHSSIIAFVLINFGKRTYNIARYFLVALYFWLLCYSVIVGFGADAMDSYFPHASRNSVTAVFIFSTLFLYSAAIYSMQLEGGNRQLASWPAIALLLLCIVSISRTAIMISLLLAIAVISYNNFRKRTLSNVIKLFIAAFLLIIFFSPFTHYLLDHTKFKGGLETPRLMMNMAYLNSIDFKSLVLGYDYRNISEIYYHNENPHNSFIRLHYNTGLAGVVFLLVSLICFSKNIFKDIRHKMLAFLGILYLARASADTIAFIGLFDFMFIYILIVLTHPSRSGLRKVFIKKNCKHQCRVNPDPVVQNGGNH